MFDTLIQYYYKIKLNGKYYWRISSSGEVTMRQLLDGIKNPSDETKQQMELIRAEPDKKKRTEIKNQLPHFVIQSYGTGNRRNYENLLHFTGIVVLDFDGPLSKQHAEQFKTYLFNTYKFIFASFISPSGKVKCFMRVEVAKDIDEYKEYFEAIEQYFSKYKGFDIDHAYTNGVQVTFLSYDPKILVREPEDVWIKKIAAEKREARKARKQTKSEVERIRNQISLSDLNREEKRTIGLVKGVMKRITTNGHPQLRSLCLSLGGYIAMYGHNKSLFTNFMLDQIESNNYLSSGDIPNYQKTAVYFIEEGIKKPLSHPPHKPL